MPIQSNDVEIYHNVGDRNENHDIGQCWLFTSSQIIVSFQKRIEQFECSEQMLTMFIRNGSRFQKDRWILKSTFSINMLAEVSQSYRRNVYLNNSDAWIQCSRIELQQLIDASALFDIFRIQCVAVGKIFLSQINGNGTRFGQNEAIVVECWYRVTWIDFDKVFFQLLFQIQIDQADLGRWIEQKFLTKLAMKSLWCNVFRWILPQLQDSSILWHWEPYDTVHYKWNGMFNHSISIGRWTKLIENRSNLGGK